MWFTTVTNSKIQILNNDIIKRYNSTSFQTCKQLSTHMNHDRCESHHVMATDSELDTAQILSYAIKLKTHLHNAF